MSDANSKNTEPNEFAGLIGTFTKYGTLLVGGLCLLMYSNEIGQFPEGMGIGEGLAFYLVCAGFLIAYSLHRDLHGDRMLAPRMARAGVAPNTGAARNLGQKAASRIRRDLAGI